MKPSAFRIERLLAKVEAEVARRGLRARRYAFHPDEVAEAEAQGLPYALVPRVLTSRNGWSGMQRPGRRPSFTRASAVGRSPSLAPVSPLLPQRRSHRRRSSRRRTCNKHVHIYQTLLGGNGGHLLCPNAAFRTAGLSVVRDL